MKTLLIIPAFNEEKRLNIQAFKNFDTLGEIHFLFANDGSTDQTKTILEELSKSCDYISVYNAPKNFGKANVIYHAYHFAKNQGLLNQTHWVGFWDADLATPLNEIHHMFTYQQNFSPDSLAIFGSRVNRMGSAIRRSPKRHYLGRIFVTIANTLLKITPYDSQCGAKLFHTSIAHIVFSEAFISRWIFDLEIIVRLKKEKILEYPLFSWEDVEGSKLNISKELFRVLKDLYLIWKKY